VLPHLSDVGAYLPLVRSVARRFARCGTPFDDLVQEGCIGLLMAARAFDPDRGNAFTTFAAPFIRGRILNALKRSLRLRLEYQAGDKLDGLCAGRPDAGGPEVPVDDRAAGWIRDVADRLDPRAPRILALWLGLDGPPLSCAAIGRKIRRTRARVHQIVSDSLLLLRDRLQAEHGDKT
jgi:RNA polymerase sigma factor (sigma-70 family)